MNAETAEVYKRRMRPRGLALLLLAVALGTLLLGTVLRRMGGNLPYVDALSTVVSVTAMIVSIRMYSEQWILWIIVDVVTVIMWAAAFARGEDSIATLVMWAVYLVNAVIMLVKWEKEAKAYAI